MTHIALNASVLVFLSAVALSNSAAAQVKGEPSEEAKRRWEQAFELAEAGNYAASVAELRALHALRPTRQVLYYIGINAAKKGSPVEAVEALEAVLLDTGPLTKYERLDVAKAVLEEQRKRVGTLMITCNVAGARIMIDEVDVEAKTPLSKAIRVASGEHLIEVDATVQGYIPIRRRVSVAGLAETVSNFELSPGGIGRVAIDVNVPGVEVWVGGELWGKTPLRDPLKLAAGVHTIELRRAGYQSVKRELRLDVGDSSRIETDLKEDGVWIAGHGGWLELELSEEPADIWVDGKARGIYGGRLRLAPGAHRIRVERGGFWGVEREIGVVAGQTERVTIRFEPKAETLERYLEGIRSRRNWGIGLMAAGVGVGVTGGFVFDHLAAEPGRKCSEGVPTACDGSYGLRVAEGISIGLGVVLLGTGIWQIAWNNEPRRYDVEVSGRPLARRSLVPMLTPTLEGRGLTMSMIGRF